MPFCNHCGKEYEEGAIVCVGCGFAVPPKQFSVVKKTYQNPPVSDGLLIASKILMILGTFLMAFFFLIPLAWCIPMTVSLFRKIKNGEPISTSFKICSLIFVSLAAGILLLCHRNSCKED